MSRPDWLHAVEQSFAAAVESSGRVALLYSDGRERVTELASGVSLITRN